MHKTFDELDAEVRALGYEVKSARQPALLWVVWAAGDVLVWWAPTGWFASAQDSATSQCSAQPTASLAVLYALANAYEDAAIRLVDARNATDTLREELRRLRERLYHGGQDGQDV